jgi:hypothetical protein
LGVTKHIDFYLQKGSITHSWLLAKESKYKAQKLLLSQEDE